MASLRLAAPPSEGVGDSFEGSHEATSSSSCTLKPLPHVEVPAFLEPYGYLASNALDWRGTPPELSVQVTGHALVGGHTLYQIACVLTRSETPRRPPHASNFDSRSIADLDDAAPPVGHVGRLAWETARRVADLRMGLYDPVRKALGSSYGTYFCRVPFAHRLRPTGTTARLDAWCARLAYCINNKLLPPAIAAEALRLLDAPVLTGVGAPAMLRGAEQLLGESEGTPRLSQQQRQQQLLEDQLQHQQQHQFLIKYQSQLPHQQGEEDVAEHQRPPPEQQQQQQRRQREQLLQPQQQKAVVDPQAAPMLLAAEVVVGGDLSGGDAGSTCTGRSTSSIAAAEGAKGPEMEWELPTPIGFGVAGEEDDELEDEEDDALTDEVLRSGLPGLEDA